MATLVEVPNHGTVEFPEGMSNEEISTAIQQNFPDLNPNRPLPASNFPALPDVGPAPEPVPPGSPWSGHMSHILTPERAQETVDAVRGGLALPSAALGAVMEKVVEPAATDIINAGVEMLNLPPEMRVQAGKSVLGEDIFKNQIARRLIAGPLDIIPGGERAAVDFAQGLTTPGGVATAPLALTKPIQGALAVGALSGMTQSAVSAATADTAEKRGEAIVSAGLQGAMAGVMLKAMAPRTAQAMGAKPPLVPDIGNPIPTAEMLLAMTPEQLTQWKKTTQYGPESPGKIAAQVPDDAVPAMAAERDRLRQSSLKALTDAASAGDDAAMMKGMQENLKAQTLNEIIDAKTLPEKAKAETLTAPATEEQPSPAFPRTATPEVASQALGIKSDIPIIGPAIETLSSPEFWKKHFTAEGALPREVYDKWVAARGEITAETRGINYNVRDLYAGLREVYGISKGRELMAGMRDVPPEAVQQMNAALLGEIPITNLPTEIQKPLQAMRDHVDKLSQDLIDRGLIDEELAVTVGDNLGTYLTRSYRIFDDPKWVEKIPPEIRQNAENYLMGSGITREQAQVKLREMLTDWSESGLDKQFRGGKLGAKDLSQFMQRQDLAPEIRAVLGEYKDPVINYARSVTKISDFIGKQQFLQGVRETGLGKFLFEEGQSKPGFDSQLAAEQSSTMSPLNGLRTSPAIKEAFENFDKHTRASGLFARTYFALNAASKMAKTVFSPLTQARNLIGQPFFNLWNGHFDFTQYGKSMKAIAADTGLTSDAGWRTYYQKLKKLGITHESARAEELRATLKDAGLKDLDFENLSGQNMARALRKVAVEAPARAYQISDELGKIVGFENEKAMLSKAHTDWTPEQVEKAAAERIRNGYPTYSMVPNIVKELRKQPVVGPFIAFPYEVIRTSYHSMRYAMQDLASDNPVLQAAGAKRAAGMMTVLFSGVALSQLSKAFLGISGKKEDDVRRFLPPWEKNAQLIFTDLDDKGQPGYINWSYQNPYSYMIDPAVAMFSNNEKDLLDKTVAAFGEFFRPFTSEQMLYGAITDVQRNTTQRGAQVYNPQDTDDEKIRKSLAHVLTAIEPGFTYRMRTKIVPAARDEQPDYGRKLDLGTEVMSELTGVKRQKMDFGQALGFKARQFREDMFNANYLFTGKVGRTGSVSQEQLVDSYETANQQRLRLWTEIARDVQAAMRNGVSATEARAILKASGISAGDVNAIIRGEYQPLRLTDYTRERAKRFGRQLPVQDLNAVRDQFKTNTPALTQ